MGGKRFLYVFGLLGGIASGVVTAALLDALSPGPFPLVLYPVVMAINVIGFTVGGWLTWLRWARSRQQARATGHRPARGAGTSPPRSRPARARRTCVG